MLGRVDDKKPVAIDETVAADFLKMGFPVPEQSIETEDGAFEVARANWETLRAFLAVESQWRGFLGFAGVVWTGIEFASIDVAMRRLNSPDYVFEELLVMEAAALKVFAEANREH